MLCTGVVDRVLGITKFSDGGFLHTPALGGQSDDSLKYYSSLLDLQLYHLQTVLQTISSLAPLQIYYGCCALRFWWFDVGELGSFAVSRFLCLRDDGFWLPGPQHH